MATKIFKQILMVYEIVFIQVKLLFYCMASNCFMSVLLPLVKLNLIVMFMVFKTNIILSFSFVVVHSYVYNLLHGTFIPVPSFSF